MKTEIKNGNWFVPVSNQMNVSGVNDSSQEIFKNSTPLKAIIRENIQNSIDAQDNKNKSVKIEIQLDSMKTKDFPGKEKFIDYVNKISESKRWQNDNDVKSLIRRIRESLSKEEIPVLRFSDYNTTGAVGATDYKPIHSNPWNLLTSTNNASGNKSDGGSGGFFGVGKNASKVASDLNTVFYTTKTSESDKIFTLGSSTLSSYIDDDENISGNIYTFSKKEDKEPLDFNIIKLDSGYLRKENGTDVFIISFNDVEDLKKNAIKYVLSEFLVSIFMNKLSVDIITKENNEINRSTINNDNLYDVIETLQSDDAVNLSIRNFYLALNDGIKSHLPEDYAKKFNLSTDDGTLYLFDRQNTNDISPTKLLMTRETGMTIFELNGFSSSSKMSGIFIATGKLSSLLRKMEGVTHTDWKYEFFRVQDEDDAKVNARALLKELKSFLYDFVRNSIKKNDEDYVFDNLINDFISIPEDSGVENDNLNNDSEIKNHIKDVKITSNGVSNHRTKAKKNKKKPVKGRISDTGKSPLPNDSLNKNNKVKPSEPKWYEVYPNEDFLISNNDEMNYIFKTSSSLKKSMIIVTIAGETKKEVPTLLDATFNGKKLRHEASGSDLRLFIDDAIKQNQSSKISLKFKEGSNLGLEVKIMKEDF